MPEAAFGTFLKLLRERRGLSLREMGRLAEVDHAYIHRLERGDKESPSSDVLGKLGRAVKADKRESDMLAALAVLPQAPADMSEFVLADPTVTPAEVTALAGAVFRGKKSSYADLLKRLRSFLAEDGDG